LTGGEESHQPIVRAAASPFPTKRQRAKGGSRDPKPSCCSGWNWKRAEHHHSPLKSLPNPQTLADERRDDADAGPPRLRLQGAGPRVAVDAFVRSGFPAVAVDSGVGVLAAVAVLDRWARRRPAAAAGLLRRARPVPDGPGGRRRSAARQGTRRGRLRLRPSAPGEELHPQPGLDRLSPFPLPCPGHLSWLVGWWWF
jgi:hypothetical protein